MVEAYLQEHPANKLAGTNRSTVAFALGDNAYSVEELVAMQFVNIKAQAEGMANEKIKELVLTVPAYWTEQERKAIIDAAELAGMRVSTLVNDGLAGTPSMKKLLICSRYWLRNNEDIRRGATVSFDIRHGRWIYNRNSRLLSFSVRQRWSQK